MATFQIIDANTVTTTKRGTEYTVKRHGIGFRVYVVNNMVTAYRRGYAIGRDFATLAEVEKKYKGLAGVAAAFEPPAPAAEPAPTQTRDARLAEIVGTLKAYGEGAISYDSEHVKELQAERYRLNCETDAEARKDRAGVYI